MQFLRNNWQPLFVILAGFGISLYFAQAPLAFLLSNTVPDDSFYYFQIARNIVHGLGSTFDGVNPTNGYHPLWLLVLLPVFYFFSSGAVLDVAPIHAALALSAIFNGVLGFVLLAILKRYTSNAWIEGAALCVWFFNPFYLYSMSNGLETSLSLLLIGLFILCALRVSEHVSWPRLAVAGVVGGLMMLARLDNLFYFVMFLAWLLYEHGWRNGFKYAVWTGTPATLVVSPWLVWNYLTFGMFLTSASAGTTLVTHRIIVQDHGPSVLQQVKAAIYMTDYTLRQVAVQTGAPSVFFILLGITAGWFIYASRGIRSVASRIPIEWFLFGGFALNFIANASIRWSPREWYFIPLGLFISIWIAWLLERLRNGGMLDLKIVIAVVTLVCALFFISWSKNLRDGYTTGQKILAVTMWMNDNLPKDATLGAFNAGTEGYFSTHRLINLDGLVNNRAYEAIRDRRLWEYVKEEHIAYIADFGTLVDYRMKSSLGIPDLLDALIVFHTTDGGPTVYTVK